MSIAALWYKAEMTKNKTKQDKKKNKTLTYIIVLDGKFLFPTIVSKFPLFKK